MHTFRYQVPVAAAWLAALMLAGCDREAPGQDAASAPAKVVAKQPRQMEFVQKIRVQANVESQESAEISSRTSGNLDLIPVGEGDRVKKGDLLFQVDRINLENNVRSQKKNVEVAEAELHIARINLNLARTVRDKAKVDLDRAERLKTSQAVSMDAYERAKLSFDQADAEIAKAEAQAGFAAARVEQEKAHLETAEKSLSDSIIRAPFAGVITLTDKDRDEYVKDGTVILKIENPDRLQLVTMISSNYYNQVIPGKTTAKILSASGKELAELPVTFRVRRSTRCRAPSRSRSRCRRVWNSSAASSMRSISSSAASKAEEFPTRRCSPGPATARRSSSSRRSRKRRRSP